MAAIALAGAALAPGGCLSSLIPDPPEVDPLLATRERWASGEPIWLEAVDPSRYAGEQMRVVRFTGDAGSPLEGEVRVPPHGGRVLTPSMDWSAAGVLMPPPPPERGAHDVRGEVLRASGCETAHSVRQRLFVRIEGAPEEIVEGVESQRVRRWFEQEARVRVEENASGVRVTVENLPEIAPLLAEAGADTLALELTLLRGGAAYATGRAWWVPGRPQGAWGNVNLQARRVRLERTPGAAPGGGSRWTLRVRSSAALALRNIEGTSYWKGEAILPAR